MKLIRFAIHDPEGFRSLPQNFEVNFLGELDYDKATDFNPYVLAGGNGSGKSNVLEALAEIFYHLDCRYLDNLPDYFENGDDYFRGYDSTKCRIDAYELEYFIFPDPEIFQDEAFDQTVVLSDEVKNKPPRRAHVRIKKIVGDSPEIIWVDRELDDNKLPELSRQECHALLPDHVIGYASGNNETLSTPFFKSRILQYEAYLATLKSQSFVDPRPETSLVYLDENYSQAILLTNLLMWGDAETGEQGTELSPFLETIGLERIDTFRLSIRLNIKADRELFREFERGSVIPQVPKDIDTRLIANLDLPEIEGKNQIRSYLNKLKLCATCYRIHNAGSFVSADFSDLDEPGNELIYLELDYKVSPATRKAFRFHFDEPVKLFELLHLLLVLNNYELDFITKREVLHATGPKSLYLAQRYEQLPKVADRILRIRNFTIRKQGVAESIDTRALSDGEHQFLHALGLCLLYKDKRTLFLFDEPETHFNPEWKAKFITAVRSCFAKEEQDADETMREMLITTHSPLVISDCEREYVRVFKRKEDSQEVYVRRPEHETLGASISKIGIDLFDMPETIGNYALAKLEAHIDELESLDSREALTDLFKRVSRDYGESVERELLRHRIIQKIEAL